MATKYLDYNGLSYLWSKIKAYVVPQTRTVNGKALSSNITLNASDVSAASSTHSHGDITSGGDITATATIASGDRIIINDESASKITNSGITFGTSTSQYLSNKGTWENIPTSLPASDVSAWAKASTKPSYTASEVGAASSTHAHGNIANGGSVSGSSAIQSGDALPVLEKTTKSLKGTSLAFGTSTTTYLRNDGTWGTPSGGGGGGSSSLIISEGGTSQSVATGTSWVTLTSSTVALPSAGIYILVGGAQYASNASGRRALCWYNESTSARVTRSFVITAPANGAATYLENILIIEATAAISYSLQVYQNSGSALSVTPYMQVVKLA